MDKDIDGYFDFSNLYRQVAAEMPKNAHLVEVGVWLGKSIIYLAEQCRLLGKPVTIYAVDTWMGSDEDFHQDYIKYLSGIKPDGLYHKFRNNIMRYQVWDLITVVRMDSLVAANSFLNEDLDFVFIDASHKYEDVKADIGAWYPKVKPGCMLAGHDFNCEDVSRAVKEKFEYYETNYNTWRVRK